MTAEQVEIGFGADLALDVIDPQQANAPELIDRACRELGFFRIPAGLVASGVVAAAWENATRFFGQRAELKNTVAFPEPGYPYGYSPYKFETLAASLGDTEARPDLKESFSAGPDCLGPGHWSEADLRIGDGGGADQRSTGEAWIRSPSLWPSAPVDLRRSWEACFRAMAGISADLLSLMAIALDLDPSYFDPLIDRHGSAMRALNYPALPDPVPAGSIRAGAHSDYGTLTVLITEDVPGLEVQRPDGSWRAVAHVADTYVVNLGDSIAQWTNDRWRSTVHRVTTVSSEPRQSMAFFHMANWDATIECLPSCQSTDNPPRYPPVQAGPWLMQKFNSASAEDNGAS